METPTNPEKDHSHPPNPIIGTIDDIFHDQNQDDDDDDDCDENDDLQRQSLRPLIQQQQQPRFVETSVATTAANGNSSSDHHTFHDNNNNNMTTTTTTFPYSMVSSPQQQHHSHPNTRSHSSNQYYNHHQHHHQYSSKSCIGVMICFGLALSLPLAYQQYTITIEENLHADVMIPKSLWNHEISSPFTTTTTKQQHLMVFPETPYLYPTREHNSNDPNDDDHSNDDDGGDDDDGDNATKYVPPKLAWLMTYPGSIGISHFIQALEYYSQTTTATNYGATLLYAQDDNALVVTTNTSIRNNATTRDSIQVIVNPIFPVTPDDQYGPFIHRLDLALPSLSTMLIHTYCSTAQTTSSSVVCTECIPTDHNSLTFERACATGNRIYEQHYRSVQYDIRVPRKFVQVLQSPFTTLLNRLRITLEQKTRMAQRYPDVKGHDSDYFAPYVTVPGRTTGSGEYSDRTTHHTSLSISMSDYCHYLDTTYAVLATSDLLDNYTHVPCHSELYRYIQWYNDAVTLTTIKYNSKNNDEDSDDDEDDNNEDDDDDDGNKKPIHYIYYEDYITTLLQMRDSNMMGDDQVHNDLQELFDFLNLPMADTTDPKNHAEESLALFDSLHELRSWNQNATNYFPRSILQKAASMIYELALPATWELLRQYLEPFLVKSSNHHSHLLDWTKRRHQDDVAPLSIAMSMIYDTNVPDDSAILSPLLFDDYRETLYENPFREHDELLLHPPEPNDPNPQVVWLLSFPNSGTSYTINNLEVTCNVTTASNYAKDWEIIVPVRPELVNGPFIHNTELRTPHYVLTKTHCFGYCDDCGPRIYNITDNEMFEQGCVRAEMTNHTGSIRYDSTVPVKAVHLYRSPFDNIVARMHLAIHKRQRQGNDISLFTNSREGLSAWCRYLDDKYSAEEEKFFSPTMLQLFQPVPCHADWYRYAQWHNHAYIMTEKLNLTVYDLFYEDYTHDYDRTLSTLFEFLNVTSKRSSIDFYVGKSYESFFDVDHARNAAILVHAISIPPVWLRLRHYFDDYM